MKPIRIFVLSLLFPGFFNQIAEAQELSKEVRSTIGSYLTQVSKKTISVGPIYIDSFAVSKNKLELYANMNCSYIPFREDNVAEIYKHIRQQLPPEFVNYQVTLITDKHPIEELIPLALRSKKDKKAKTFVNDIDKPLITRISVPYRPTKGLLNRHIAMKQSGVNLEQLILAIFLVQTDLSLSTMESFFLDLIQGQSLEWLMDMP